MKYIVTVDVMGEEGTQYTDVGPFSSYEGAMKWCLAAADAVSKSKFVSSTIRYYKRSLNTTITPKVRKWGRGVTVTTGQGNPFFHTHIKPVMPPGDLELPD